MPRKWKEDIFKQKGLWEVYRLSKKAFPSSKQNKRICIFAAVALLIVFGASIGVTPESYKAKNALQFMNWVSGQSFTLSLGILGFLIAGFSIFASITNVNIFISLAETPYEQYPAINNLQYVFFNFLNVFAVYVGLLAISLGVQFMSADSSPLLSLFPKCIHEHQRILVGAGEAVSFIICQWTVISVLRLKSFIWNLYQTVLLAIALEDEMKKRTN